MSVAGSWRVEFASKNKPVERGRNVEASFGSGSECGAAGYPARREETLGDLY